MQTALEWLQSLPRLSGEPGLDRMKALLAALGDPQKRGRYVHIAGTNGKGSVAAFTANILQKAGFKTGLTISPYVRDFRERFQIDGQMIPPDALERLAAKVRAAAETLTELPVQFEAVTALALAWFDEEQCDIAVLETGLGGRFDATNAVENTLVAAITRIDLDHTELLGGTVEEIAAEKAVIIKPGCIAVTYPVQEKGALQAIAAACIREKADLAAPEAEDIHLRRGGLFENRLEYGGYEVNLALPGAHQACNAAMAIEIALALWRQGMDIPDEAILEGLETTRFPARIEVLRGEPLVLLDGSHNPAGAAALAATLKAQKLPQKPVAVLGVLADKAVAEMLRALGDCFSTIYAVTPDCPRAMSAEALAELAARELPEVPVYPCADLDEALNTALGLPQGAVVCGSLYLAAQARPKLLERL
ncbi:bifunctional folylpolyglutamate synthase/dihydrofolate synthase [Candidatus Allofournierella merdipullorum]|uniref:bifunctional folylpolyglutamate synthase/dihydrofolate synthase n=2 Tax=Eubacteriales TaxID=186802 RepID=UPI002A8ED0D9|nr:folylpolyglutamate synthase/dihydrofolate synthase family protein [Candidatus Fournierella merdipullorum]